jgi:hypothetical protein
MHDPRFDGGNPPCTAQFHDRSVFVRLLPYLGQSTLATNLDDRFSIYAVENAFLHEAVVDGFACPSDPGSSASRPLKTGQLLPIAPDIPGGPRLMARTSYRANFGTLPINAMLWRFSDCRGPPRITSQLNGCFNDLNAIRFAAIHDGLSGTILLSETALSTLEEIEPIAPGTFAQYGVWVGGDLGDSLFSTFDPPNAYRSTGPAATWARIYAASSLHVGGVNEAMADGSVRLVRETIDSWQVDPIDGWPKGIRRLADGSWENIPPPGVWQMLSTRDSGETAVLPEWGFAHTRTFLAESAASLLQGTIACP